MPREGVTKNGGDEMRITALIAAILLVAAVPANAVFVGFDTAGNGTAAGADPLVSDDFDFNTPLCDLSADVGLGSLSAGDVDFYSVTVPNGCILTFITTPLSPTFSVPDTTLGLVDSSGVTLGISDDSGTDIGGAPGFQGGAIRFVHNGGNDDGDGDDTYYIVVSGYGDFDWDGLDDFSGTAHPQEGDYLLTVSIHVPEPSTVAMVLGGLVMFARRRRR